MISFSKKSKMIATFGCILLLLVFFIGCKTVEVKKMSAKNPDQYNLFKNIEGLSVAIEPFFRGDVTETTFGIDLIKEGIYPVFVVIENQSTSSFLLNKKNISLYMKQPVGEKHDTAGFLMVLTDEPEPLKSIVTLVFPITIFVTSFYDADKKEISERTTMNIRKNELQDNTVYPNESTCGFVYFPINNSEGTNINQHEIVLNIDIERLSIKNKIKFEFTIPSFAEGKK